MRIQGRRRGHHVFARVVVGGYVGSPYRHEFILDEKEVQDFYKNSVKRQGVCLGVLLESARLQHSGGRSPCF